ncbi:hypothetical protein [Christensenella massiliensis]|uniref:Lipoprotein n=1 Tax=Christensenella massiliensis TaxID=1805714 RepID=A0AAU8A6G8_9FIRM
MNLRKRILAAVTVVALCMAFVGCGGIFLSKNDKEKFYVTDPSLHVLEDMDEFGVYEDGKAILMPEEMGDGMDIGITFNKPYSEYFGEYYTGKEYDFRGRDITTKRGIGIGSTMEEVIEAYPDIAFLLFSEDAGDQNIFDLSPAQVEYRIRDYEDEEQYFIIQRYELKDGELLSGAGYCDYIHENGLHGGYVFANQEEYFESIWEISFTVKDGVITHIGIGSETL